MTTSGRHESVVSHAALHTTGRSLIRGEKEATFCRSSSRRSGMLSYTDDLLGACPRISTDLMGDPDLQAMFRRSYSSDGLNKCDQINGSEETENNNAEDLLYSQCMTDTLVSVKNC